MEVKDHITLWTSQSRQVIDVLERDGHCLVKKEYISKKYQETTWSFSIAYSYFAKRAAEKIARPEGAESPFWLYRDPKWAVTGPDAKLLKFQIPREEVILFDLRKWNRILNLSPLGDEKRQKEFEQELKRQGIMAYSDVFEKPYYPLLKNRIIKSWDLLFEDTSQEELYTQGAAWVLRKEWLCGEHSL
ncbi:DUF3841 domain-containing protein [Roseburia hominis]